MNQCLSTFAGNLLRIPKLEKTSLRELVDGEEEALRRPDGMSDEDLDLFIDFLEGMLRKDPKKRKTAEVLLNHGWLKI